MNGPNREEQRKLVQQKEETSKELERMRREALRGMPYNWKDVDALLELGADCPHVERYGGSLAEMQRHFMKAHPRA